MKFIQYKDNNQRFDSEFSLSKRGYFVWHGESLPSSHPLAYLKKLHLVSAKNFEHMNGKANMDYFVEKKSIKKLSALLLITEEKAREVIDNPNDPEHQYEKFLPEIKNLCKNALRVLSSVSGLLVLGEPSNLTLSLTLDQESHPYPIHSISTHSTLPLLDTGDIEFYVAPDYETAEEKAREYYLTMDTDDLIEVVGKEALINWALGKPYAPGNVSVNSLEEWLDLSLDAPEEVFSGYDGSFYEATISQSLADELGYSQREVVVFRNS